MCFFNDNRDNADNGLSATRTELTLEALWIYGLRGAGKKVKKGLEIDRKIVSLQNQKQRGWSFG